MSRSEQTISRTGDHHGPQTDVASSSLLDWTETSTQRALVRVLAMCHHEKLDTAEWCHLLAADVPRRDSAGLVQFATSLSIGVPVNDALAQTPGLMSPRVVLALRIARETGTTGDIYREILNDTRRQPGPGIMPTSPRQQVIRCVFLIVLLIFMQTFLSLLIWPLLQSVSGDLGFPMSEFDWWIQWQSPVFMVLVGALGLVGIGGLSMGRLTQGGTTQKRTDVLRLIADALDAGRPVAAALPSLARSHPDARLRQSLLAICQSVGRGDDPWSRLHGESFLSARQAESMAMTADSATGAWLLRRWSDTREDRDMKRRQWIPQVSSTLMLLFVAGHVAWLTISTFQFLTQLIHTLAAV